MSKSQPKVKDLMQKSVYTVGPDDMIDRVFFLIHYEKIRHLPVVEKDKIVGIVTDRDLYKALGPKSNSNGIESVKDGASQRVIPKLVRHIMHRKVVTVEPDDEAGKAAFLMADLKIGALPVVRKGKLAGIVTATDILMQFAEYFYKKGK
jgi:acetoin utilization protein AcuB